MITINAALASVVAFMRGHKGNDRGATAVEYGLMVALIAAVIAAIVFTLGQSLNTKFSNVNSCVQSASSGGCP